MHRVWTAFLLLFALGTPFTPSNRTPLPSGLFRHATPTPTPPPPEPEATLTLEELGYPAALQLSGNLAEAVITLPVPRGWQPRVLEGEVAISPFLERGLLFVEQQDRLLASLPLPPETPRLQVNLTQARVQQGLLVLRLRTVLDPDNPDCAAPLTRWVTLKNLRVRFSGRARPPETLAEFWPPDLRTLVLQVPGRLSPGLSTAALRLVTHAALQTRGHPLQVRILPLGEPLAQAPGPFTRVVRLKTGLEAQLALEPLSPNDAWPALLIQGPEVQIPALVDQVLAQWQPLLPMARVTVEGLTLPQRAQRLTLTLASLNYQELRMQGAGILESRIVFRQADFGQPIAAVAVRLRGYTTPLPAGGTATLTLLFNGGLVYAQPLDQGGPLDLRVNLPEALLRRDNTLTLRVLYTPPGGQCRVGVHDIIVDINPEASYLQATPGASLDPGFGRFPQSLLPTFQVSLEDPSLTSLEQAARLLAALQRLSPNQPLRPHVVPWQEGLQSQRPLLALAASAQGVRDLQPPLEPVPFRLVDYQGQELLRLEPDQGFAVLQAFEHRGRDVLLLAYWQNPALVDRLLAYLDTPEGWYQLSGDVWLLAEQAEPVSFRLRESGVQAIPLEDRGWTLPPSWRPWLALGLVLLLLGLLAWSYPRLVRHRPIDEA